MKNWSGKNMILNLCIIIQTKSWIFLSIISLWFFQMFNLCLTLLLSKLDIYCIVSSLITQLLFMRCQRFKFCLYFLNMKKFLINKKIKEWYFTRSNSQDGICMRYMPSSPPWWVTQCHYWWTFRLGSGCQLHK